MHVGHLHFLFGSTSVQFYFLLGLFDFCFVFMLNCMSCLYMLDVNPLLVISFANIFSHSVSCFFFLSMVFFAVQKLLSLVRSHLEKAMAPHSSTLAWKIPWTEEPGRLQSMGSLRVRHN